MVSLICTLIACYTRGNTSWRNYSNPEQSSWIVLLIIKSWSHKTWLWQKTLQSSLWIFQTNSKRWSWTCKEKGNTKESYSPLDAPSCDPSYPDFCINPNSADLDCGEIPYKSFRVIGADKHDLDRDTTEWAPAGYWEVVCCQGELCYKAPLGTLTNWSDDPLGSANG